MRQVYAAIRINLSALFLWGLAAIAATGEPTHGIAMYGAPALPPDFVSLPYANADAPSGGRIILGESGSFDSLNPYSIKGRHVWALPSLTIETLMGRSIDEPFTLYGLIAESIRTDAARSWVEFTLRAEARFADGSPITVKDVLWSFEALGTKGNPPHPRYAATWARIARAEQTGPRSLRLIFNVPDRELPLIIGLYPILQQADWAGRDLSQSTMRAPMGSGPYRVAEHDPGRSIRFVKNPDWWGKDLPFNRGRFNLDEIRYEYFGDGNVVFEAFKAGTITSFREGNAQKWQQNYDFPAVRSGAIVKSEVPHHRPSGMEGLVMNTRRALFADWRVREALLLAFNFEFINETLNGGLPPRIQSYFSNSTLGMEPGKPATGEVAALLAPFADSLFPGAQEGYALPRADGSQRNRGNMRLAADLLSQAGWESDAAGRLRNAAGEAFDFEILLTNGATEAITIAAIYAEALKRLGIMARVATVDSAQMKERTDSYDFDMTYFLRAMSLSPGTEQRLYWNAAGVTQPGSRNLMGMNSAAAEAMIDRMLETDNPATFIAATRALDRILMSGRYVVPFSFATTGRLAHIRELRFPDRIPVYGDWPGFQPDTWWYEK